MIKEPINSHERNRISNDYTIIYKLKINYNKNIN